MVADNAMVADNIDYLGRKSWLRRVASIHTNRSPDAKAPRMYSALALAGTFVGILGYNGMAVAATITLMSPTVNDGSFESVNTSFFAPTSLTAWPTITNPGVAGSGGLLSNPPNNSVLAGAHGHEALFADLNTTTATSINLLGTGGYMAVQAGDIFNWSFMVNSHRAASFGTIQLDFGSGNIQTLGTGTAGDTDLSTFLTISGSYTATATDAASGSLKVLFSTTVAVQSGAVYGDNVNLSVESVASVPEPATLGLLAFGLAALGVRRRTR